MRYQLLRILLLVAASPMATVRAYPMEQVESRPIDGHKFVEGQPFRFACRAVGNSDLALRMICPLTEYAPGSIVSDACFENCGRPLCNQPGLNDCSETMPELKSSQCVRTVSLLTDGSQEIRIEYSFPQATVRMAGTYSCQYKNMRSSVQLLIEATTTTSTTSTTATTRTSTTSTPSTSTTRRTTTPVVPTTTRPTTKTTQVKSGAVEPTPTVQFVPVDNTDRSLDPDRNQGKADSPATDQPVDRSDQPELPMKTGWFYNSLVGKLAGIDLVLIVLLIVLATVLLVGFLFIRCQVAAIGRSSGDAASPKRPLHRCCANLLCITIDNGGGTSKANGHHSQLPPNYNQQQKQHQRLMKAPPIQPFSNGSDTASGQVYSEANLDSSYYSQGEASDTRDAEYRLQTHFDAADARAYPMVSGSQRGPRVGGGFFNRDAPDRHSFHNVRVSRQRPAIPVDLLMRANGGEVGAVEAGGAQLSREEIRDQVEKQRREIDNLRQLLRDSQQQLSRLASSQQELNRSVSVTRMPTTAASSATTPDEVPSGVSPTDPQGDYELLARASSVNPPTVQTSSGDLLQLAIEEPIQEEEDDEHNGQESQESVQYPTVKSANKRRSSMGEAYESGRLCPA